MSKKISRRQFLTYTLGSTAGFLGAGMLFPMVRFAVDPALKKGGGGNFIDVNLPLSEVTDKPKSVQFKVHKKDGWYSFDEVLTAWVLRDKGKILALSPVCKHLGCTVSWESNPQFPNTFFCPCHFGRYTKDGTNVPGTPPAKPLDHYETKEANGKLLIGPLMKT
ncbi:ubiquinol-cytochrome c reductase iron-sulfur subunit [Shimazuella kribbensis]|uniref:QcrA and Rieske domain-containing protein n=1 Tax=Shimazuella kribbensis TaxID=139808 RepID=UPI0004298936|nr:ubiquinol-cytochrome c reductase iron-sulfur subunit [Shimazuella kribbensis]